LDIRDLFSPPPGAGRRTAWERPGEDAHALVRALHDLPWHAGDQGETYKRWRGEGPTDRKLAVKGGIKLMLAEVDGDRRVDFFATLRVLDEGKMADRYGPNSWRDEWTHKLSGWVRFERDGRVASFELRDEFEVTGAYYNPGTTGDDPNARRGSLRIAGSIPKSLTADEEQRVRRMVALLGDDVYAVRQKATNDLAAWAEMDERVADVIRALEPTQADPEVRNRLKVIRDRFQQD
jgi:hypothetical protein